jgi:diacylglycerol kinase (ATP)
VSINSERVNRRALVIFNPAAGWVNRRKIDRFVRLLGERGCDVALRETTARGDAEAMARDSSTQEFDVVVAAGGDGTINEVVNGLGAIGEDAPPLGIVPLGTANVFAHELGLSLDMAQCADAVALGDVQDIYIGCMNRRRFIQMAGVGFDARVVSDVTPGLKRRLGKAAYVLMTLYGMFRYRLPVFEVEIGGAAYRAASIVIAKGHFYGGRFTCAARARLQDPTFQVCLFEKSTVWSVIRYSLGLLRGRLGHYPDVRIVEGRSVRIVGREDEPVQADGDIVTTLPVLAEIVPQRFRVMVGTRRAPPSSAAASQ